MSHVDGVVKHMLEGAEMSGFEYSTGLTLRLDHYGTDRAHDPAVVELNVNCSARLLRQGENWQEMLSGFSVHTNQPAQPLLAALLVRQRSDGGSIQEARVDGVVLQLRFRDGSRLTVEGDRDGMGVDWAVYESGRLPHLSGWSVIGEDGVVRAQATRHGPVGGRDS